MVMHKTIENRAAVVFTVALCSACSVSSAPGQGGITPDAVADEFRSEQTHLTLSPGWEWPGEPHRRGHRELTARQLYTRRATELQLRITIGIALGNRITLA